MNKRSFITMLAAAAFAVVTGGAAMAETTKTTEAGVKAGHAEVNGVNYYYEIRGEGEPLLLLHGGLGSIDMFGPVSSKQMTSVIGI